MFNEFEIHGLSALLRTLTLACMKENGYVDTDLPNPQSPGVSKHNERRYGITDSRLAASLGYRPTPRATHHARLKGRSPQMRSSLSLEAATSPEMRERVGETRRARRCPRAAATARR